MTPDQLRAFVHNSDINEIEKFKQALVDELRNKRYNERVNQSVGTY